MPYTLKLYIYLFVANVLVIIVAVRWLSSYDWMLAVIVAGVHAYLANCLGALVVWTEKIFRPAALRSTHALRRFFCSVLFFRRGAVRMLSFRAAMRSMTARGAGDCGATVISLPFIFSSSSGGFERGYDKR